MCSASRILVQSGLEGKGTGRRAGVCGPHRFSRINAKVHSQLPTRPAQSTLAPMNWHRGLLLAGINVAIAMPGVVRESMQFWQNTAGSVARASPSRVEYVMFQEGVPISLDPCNWSDLGHSRLIEVGGFANLPTALLTGWHDPCLTQTRLGRLSARVVGGRNHSAEVLDCLCLAILISTQWLLVGGLPIIQPKRWWLEPGALITASAAIAAALAIIPITQSLARIPALFAGLAWLWYLALLLWVPVHLAWQSTLHGLRRLS